MARARIIQAPAVGAAFLACQAARSLSDASTYGCAKQAISARAANRRRRTATNLLLGLGQLEPRRTGLLGRLGERQARRRGRFPELLRVSGTVIWEGTSARRAARRRTGRHAPEVARQRAPLPGFGLGLGEPRLARLHAPLVQLADLRGVRRRPIRVAPLLVLHAQLNALVLECLRTTRVSPPRRRCSGSAAYLLLVVGERVPGPAGVLGLLLCLLEVRCGILALA